ncbi:MAG: alpha/beta fold hydrolase, partial [Candidatus Zixiibacteriota bacterium]
MPYFESEKIRLYYEITGEGTPLIMLHGFSLDRRMWRYQVDAFAQSHNIIMPDARGHGLSDAPSTDYAREDRTADIQNIVNHLGIDRFHLLGFSMGGGDALAYAIDQQERLLSLTLAATVAAGWQPPKRFRDFAGPAHEIGVAEAKKQY